MTETTRCNLRLMSTMSFPVIREARSSAKACRNSKSLIMIRRMLTTKFHNVGESLPPCGNPLSNSLIKKALPNLQETLLLAKKYFIRLMTDCEIGESCNTLLM